MQLKPNLILQTNDIINIITYHKERLIMPTGKQIRAARILVDWDADDLARRIGMSRVSIQNIERGDARPKDETIEKIVRTFSDVGIEFTENEGIRRRPQGVEIFEGPDRYEEFYDYIYTHLKRYGGDVCCSLYDETLASRNRKTPESHRKRMKELVDRGDVTFRVLATKSDFVQHGYAQFKWLPKQHATPTGFYAFGDCLALMSFVKENSPYVIVIQSAPLAEGYRQGFNVAWTAALEPPAEGTGVP